MAKRASAKPTVMPTDALAAVVIPGMGKVGDVAAEWKPIAFVKRWDRNPRLNAHVVEGVATSIRTFGFGSPLVCRSDGTLIAGDTRIQAAHKLALDAVPVRVMDHLSAKQAEALAIADNRLAERAKWNEPLLGELLASIDEQMRTATGFAIAEAARMIAMVTDAQLRAGAGIEDDQAPEASEQLRRKWGVELGQLWSVGASRILCGDSTNTGDTERLFAGEKACLLNTDAPYGVDLVGAKDGIPRPGFRDMARRKATVMNDELTTGPALQAFLETVFRAALPHLTDETAWYIWHAHLTQGFFAAAAAAAADVILHRQIVWVKPGFILTRSGMYHWKHEPCFFGWRRGHKPRWYGSKSQTSVWIVGRDNDRGMHPTQRPLELFTIPLLNHTKKGDLCYEPFSGSGSQLLAAELCGRRCAAMELDPRYVAVLLERATLRGMVVAPCP